MELEKGTMKKVMLQLSAKVDRLKGLEEKNKKYEEEQKGRLVEE